MGFQTDIKIVYSYKDIFYMAGKIPNTVSAVLSQTKIPVPNHNISLVNLPDNVYNGSALFNLNAAAHYTVGGGHITRRKDRNDYQLILTVSGQAHVTYNEKEYLLLPGSVMLVDCRLLHEYRVDEKDIWEYKHIHFNTKYPEALLNDVPVFLDSCPLAFYFFDEIKKFSNSPDAGGNIAPYVYSNLLDNLLTALVKKNYSMSSDKLRINFSEILNYIHQHYRETISIPMLAKQFGYSESYFIRAFKRNYNYTPHQYILKYRIERVYELLLNGETVQSAALACGFNSASSFYHAIKKNIG